MKHRLIALLLLPLFTAVSSPLYAEAFFDKVSKVEFSPDNDILVQTYFEREGMAQIWLVSSADPGRRQLLFTHYRNANVIFSPDQKWLVINDRYASNESRLLLFKQKSFLNYEQVADITKAAWEFFKKQMKTSVEFDHSYVEALSWAEDEPPTLLLSLRGHSDSKYTSEWYCFYDVKSKTFSVDLAAHNKRMTKIKAEAE